MRTIPSPVAVLSLTPEALVTVSFHPFSGWNKLVVHHTTFFNIYYFLQFLEQSGHSATRRTHVGGLASVKTRMAASNAPASEDTPETNVTVRTSFFTKAFGPKLKEAMHDLPCSCSNHINCLSDKHEDKLRKQLLDSYHVSLLPTSKTFTVNMGLMVQHIYTLVRQQILSAIAS